MKKKLLRKHYYPYIISILIILVGAIVFFSIPVPEVVLLKFYGSIDDNAVNNFDVVLRSIEDRDSVRAMVLVISSPGGSATASEELYLRITELSQRIPVVVSVDGLAASGAYYMAAGSNYIIAKPSSGVGSVGVVSVLPGKEQIPENTIVSGPYKRTMATPKQYAERTDLIKQAFVTTIVRERGSKLKLSAEELSEAEVYIGAEALEYGLIDEIGSTEKAISKAASLAHIVNYHILDLSRKENLDMVTALSVNRSIFNDSTNTVPIDYMIHISE